MAGTSLYMFWFRFIVEMFSALSAALSFVLCSFGCSLFGRLFDFREFNKAKFNGNGNEYNGGVSVRYNFCSFLCRYLRKVTIQQREKATFCIFERTWTVRGQFLKFLFRNLTLSYNTTNNTLYSLLYKLEYT